MKLSILACIILLIASCSEETNENEAFLLETIWEITDPVSDSVLFMRHYSDQLIFRIESVGGSHNCTFRGQGLSWKWNDENSIEIYRLKDSVGHQFIEEIHIDYLNETKLSIHFYDDDSTKREATYEPWTTLPII
jgi:hypothetical protein